MERRTDPYLSFGLLLTPGRIAQPVTDQLVGRSFAELDCGEAALVLEGVIYLQWIKAAIVGGIGLLTTYEIRNLTGALAGLFSSVSTGLMMWLPAYMLILSGPFLFLRRKKSDSHVMLSAHPPVLRLVRYAHLVAVIPAVLITLSMRG